MLVDEELRLQELSSYGILFSEPEPAFDRITGLAKRLFRVPIVLISFVDRDIQWFKSCIGVPISSTSREISFCSHAISQECLMIVPDTTLDKQFADNPLVVGEPYVRFYAGAPLINSRNFRLGTLCIIDTDPRPSGLTADEQNTLGDLAAMTVSELELRVAMNVQQENIRKLEIADRNAAIANKKLSELARNLARSNDDLASFARICSHDLQAPARTTGLMLQLLARRSEDLLDAESKQCLHSALDNSKRMVRLVSDVLTYASAAAPQNFNQAQTVNTNDVFESAVSALAASVEESGADVTSANLPNVSVDRQFLLQVFQNLIANGITYHREAAPRIHVSCQQIDNCHVFCIEDNGIGIDKSFCEVIFEPFKRLHGPATPGSGVGLSTCKLLIERAGGRIWVESVIDQGSKFFFSLPIEPGMNQ